MEKIMSNEEKFNSRLSASKRGYGHKWRKARNLFLMEHPLCCFCDKKGEVVEASVVDHIVPHKGNDKLFWDVNNWQALCKTCHQSTKQFIENRGYSKDIGADGWPTDPKHPTNK